MTLNFRKINNYFIRCCARLSYRVNLAVDGTISTYGWGPRGHVVWQWHYDRGGPSSEQLHADAVRTFID